MSTGKKVVVGLALAAAAAGIYAFVGEHGKKNRAKVASWARKMEADVLAKMEGLKAMSQDKYQEVIDTVSRKYQALRDLDPVEVIALAGRLKRHWSQVKAEMKEVSNVARPATPASKKRSRKPVTH